ncbi:MAG: hypothetical protein Q4F69_12640 [Bacteroidia bacterium]|nr:hypothetical protein [Bacteroidia bacterium]
MKKIIAIIMSLVFILSMSACGKQSEKTISENVIASTEEQEVSTDLSDSPEEIIVSEEPTESEETSEEWSFLEGKGGWHQRLTDEHLKNAKYLFDQGLDSALESHCVLLYKDEARDFALYYSFKSYQYDDLEDVLIVSNGKRTVAKGCGAWEKADLRETASACDLDGDGFEEILIRVITGTHRMILHMTCFLFAVRKTIFSVKKIMKSSICRVFRLAWIQMALFYSHRVLINNMRVTLRV